MRPGMESVEVIENFDNGFFVWRKIHRLFGLGADHDEAQNFGRQEIRHLPAPKRPVPWTNSSWHRRPEKTRMGC